MKTDPGTLLLLALLLSLPQPAPAQRFPADAELELMLHYIVEDRGVPGIVLGLLEPDGSRRVLARGSGGRDARPLGPRSVFEIGSITKTFTGTLLADMVARGEVALDDPVAKYLPDRVTVPSRGGRQITLLDLATHRSGLPMWGGNPAVSEREASLADFDVEAMYAFLSGHQLRREPGAAYAYSNLGFGLLGHALARAAGTTFPELLRERILEPLGMDMTAFVPRGEMEAWMTEGSEPGAVVPVTDPRRGAGGLLTHADDMLTYLEANVGPPQTDLQRAMRTAHRTRAPTDHEDGRIGLGWQTQSSGEDSVVFHGGRRNGYMARIAFHPEEGTAAVVLANTEDFRNGSLATALLFMAPPPADWNARLERSTLLEYAGTYRADDGASFYVRLEEEGWLTYQPPRNARTRLYPRSDSSFFMLRGPWTLTFRRDGSGEVVGMRMEMDEREPAQQGTGRALGKVSADTPSPRAVAVGTVSSVTLPWDLALKIVGAGVALVMAALLAGRLRKNIH